MTAPHIGIMFRREDVPEHVVSFSQHAEAAGFDEVWIVEDCFYASGIAPVTAVLAHTQRIHVGLGIMPAVARNAAFTALEIATLARLYPQRFLPGLGHGVREWMKQIGALPKSQLAALEETTEVVRALLRGENVTFAGQHVTLTDVKLEFPPDHVPPISLGVRGPKSLQLAGRVADGTILGEGTSPTFVRWAREQIDQGRVMAPHAGPHRITVYIWCALDDDANAARDRIRLRIASGLVAGNRAYWNGLGFASEIEAIIAAGGDDPVGYMSRVMPDSWLHDLAVVGTPQQGVDTIHRLAAAGADAVVLVPLPTGDFEGQMETFAHAILPAFRH